MKPISWKFGVLTVIALALSPGAGPVRAQEKASGWEYDLVPLYLWGVSVSGDATIKSPPASVTVPLNVDFKDAVKDLAAAFTVYFEARNRRWGYYGNFSYLRLKPESQLPTGQTVNIDFRNPLIEAAGMYRLGTAGESPWWLVGGVRFLGLRMDVTGIPSPPLPFGALDVSENFTDVFAGVRYRREFAERWTVLAQGDIGAGQSDLTWSATLYASYQFHKHASVLGGWRWLDYKIRKSSVDMDMLMSGPLIALKFNW